jgi:hypothetical protein
MELHFDSYCGLYCGACDMLVAYRRAQERGVEARWDNIHFPLKGHFAASPVICHGCKGDVVFRGCRGCPIRKCARTMLDIETCLDCKRFPCYRHWLVNAVRRVAGLNRKLPHLSVIEGNRAAIREKGVAAWLEDQERRWACPSCRTAFSWYERVCPTCGRSLDDSRPFRLGLARARNGSS